LIATTAASEFSVAVVAVVVFIVSVLAASGGQQQFSGGDQASQAKHVGRCRRGRRVVASFTQLRRRTPGLARAQVVGFARFSVGHFEHLAVAAGGKKDKERRLWAGGG
jgi:hypothetical protein